MFKPDTLITGATGLIGRWLVPQLTEQGKSVAVLIRNASKRSEEYKQWISLQNGNPAKVKFFEFDLTAPDNTLSNLDISQVKDVYHLAARYQFGLNKHEAHKTNVLGSLGFLQWCNQIPNLRRFIFVTGYLAATHAKAIQRLSINDQQKTIENQYKKTGAYEASKIEENIVLQQRARSLNIPYTIINPSAIIGDSKSGHTNQFIGPGDLVADLFYGKLPALVGGADIFIPLVSVDFVAKFMARITQFPQSASQSYWLLDQSTPNLPELVKSIANHLGVSFPTKSIPKAVVARLPKAITGTDPEALSFLTNLRYDTKNAENLALKMDISLPDFNSSLKNWIDFLVSKNFGSALHHRSGHFKNIAGSQSFLSGETSNADYVLLHGLPLDSQSWQGLENELDGNILRADLPGHGRSGGTSPDPLPWMKSLMQTCKSRPTIIAHSIGCEYALKYAMAHPDAVSQVVLISPFFLQKQASLLMRNPTIFSSIVKLAGAAKILKQATGLPDEKNPLIASAVANLQRPGKIKRFANELARVSKPELRLELRKILKSIQVPVTIIVGENDPLLEGAFHHKTHIIQKSGHNPQLINPKQLANIITSTGQNRLQG